MVKKEKFESLSTIQKCIFIKRNEFVVDWWNNRPCLSCEHADEELMPNTESTHCRNCHRPQRLDRLDNEQFREMIKGVIGFSMKHGWDHGFGDKEEKDMKKDNFGILKLTLECGCSLVLGLMDNATYHLHSLEMQRDDGKREVLFVV